MTEQPARMKSSVAQSEILIAILFLSLVSGAVIAQNATNLTNFTGDFLANISIPNASHQQTPSSGGTPENMTISGMGHRPAKTIEVTSMAI